MIMLYCNFENFLFHKRFYCIQKIVLLFVNWCAFFIYVLSSSFCGATVLSRVLASSILTLLFSLSVAKEDVYKRQERERERERERQTQIDRQTEFATVYICRQRCAPGDTVNYCNDFIVTVNYTQLLWWVKRQNLPLSSCSQKTNFLCFVLRGV